METKSVEQLIEIVKEADAAIVFDIKVESFFVDEENLYCELDYQIDDTNEDRNSDEDIQNEIQEKLGSEYGVFLERMDAYPNGLAFYKITIDR